MAIGFDLEVNGVPENVAKDDVKLDQ